jgi:hypothetical protein
LRQHFHELSVLSLTCFSGTPSQFDAHLAESKAQVHIEKIHRQMFDLLSKLRENNAVQMISL